MSVQSAPVSRAATDTKSPAETPANLARRIGQRVAAKPDGLIRSYRLDGHHRTGSYLALWRRAGDIAAALHRAGIIPGSPVVILAEDVVDHLPAIWACLRGGFVAVPLTGVAREAMHRDASAFERTLALLGDPCIITDEAFGSFARRHAAISPARHLPLASVEAVPPRVDAEPGMAPACLLATSGTTGRLKLAALSHATLIRRYLDAAPGPVATRPHALSVHPLDSISGHAVYLRHESWTQIGAHALAARPSVVLDAVEEFGISTVHMPSSLMGRILADENRAGRARNLGSLGRVALGAEPISPRAMREFAALLQRSGVPAGAVQAGYGSTETGPLVSGSGDGSAGDPDAAVRLGRPRAGVAMRIVGEAGTVLGDGEVGEVQVDCPAQTFSGYWGDPGLTHAGFAADGWWRTGDLGQLQDGELTLHGRLKEILIVHGRKFALADIDRALEAQLDPGDQAFSCVIAGAGHAAERLGIGFRCADAGPARHAAVAGALRAAVARRFGIDAGAVAAVETIPTARNGKLARAELARLVSDDLAQDRPAPADRGAEPSADAAATVTAIWRTVLGIDGPVDPHANFFDLGGDSLRALTLYVQLGENLGVHIESDAFFADPTLRALIARVGAGATATATTPPSDTAWPLPRDLRQRVLAPLETWPGERPTPSRLVVGHHTDGARPPIFWVLNTAPEPAKLASVLGDDQPLYAFRSDIELGDRNEDDVQAFALRYMAEIERICPEGPFFIGGHCHGGVIALAIAQHALRRKRHVPLLVLMDWAGELQAYAGRVLLVAGRRNHARNARRRFALPELAWHRAFGSFDVVEVDGSYALDDHSLPALGAVLTARMRTALSASAVLLPSEAYRASLSVDRIPRRMAPGRRTQIRIVVRNDSGQDWPETAVSGLTAGVRWSDADGDVVVRSTAAAPLPTIAAGAAVTVALDLAAPNQCGDYRLHIDLCEQGNRWFNADPAKATTIPVRVDHAWPVALGRRWRRARSQPDRARGPFAFDLASPALFCLVSGWSTPEAWGTWSEGPTAKLRLPLAGARGRWRALFTCKAFGPPHAPVTVQARGGSAAQAVDWSMPADVIVQRELDVDASGDDVTVQFTFPNPASPRDLGLAADSRQLGLGLIAVTLVRLSR